MGDHILQVNFLRLQRSEDIIEHLRSLFARQVRRAIRCLSDIYLLLPVLHSSTKVFHRSIGVFFHLVLLLMASFIPQICEDRVEGVHESLNLTKATLSDVVQLVAGVIQMWVCLIVLLGLYLHPIGFLI